MLTVGQKLLYVPYDARFSRVGNEPRGVIDVTVSKIGRKWATLDARGMRVDMNTMEVDGGDHSSQGRCYLSLEHYKARQRAKAAWSALRREIEYKAVPDRLTAADIAKAADALGITLPIPAAELV